MKHLHLQFILASFALGLGFVFLFSSIWSIHALPVFGWTPLRTFLSAIVTTMAGGVLVAFGVHGVRHEVKHR